MIKHLIFLLTTIYTVSFSIFELKGGNKVGFVATLVAVLFSAFLFLEYLN